MPEEAGDAGAEPSLFKVWKTYEDIAMHFNDMLLRLRIQALAGVAALAVLASIFSNVRTFNFQGTWMIASAAFAGLMMIWLAIWLLDRCYYSRLLMGSVRALVEIEKLSQSGEPFPGINLSSQIEKSVTEKKDGHPPGVRAFYRIVFFTLFIGWVVTTYAAINFRQEPLPQPPLLSQ